jgi:hypothetical protein
MDILNNKTLNEDGYLLIKNGLNENELIFLEKSINNKLINYTLLKEFIDNIFTKKINTKLNWNLEYTKFRLSNNNNSDASSTHRDIICYDKNKNTYPIFTCLTYLQNTILEIIPKSHTNPTYKIYEIFKLYYNIKKINIKRGDILVFNSRLLHRGIFTEKLKNRYLLQVFEVYPNIELYNLYSKKVIHIKGEEEYKNQMTNISKINFIINFINYLSFINSATGYGYNENIMKKLNINNEFTYVSSDGFTNNLKIIPNKLQKINKYILNKNITYLNKEDGKIFRYYSYNKQFIKYGCVIFVFIIILLFILYYYFKYKKY